MPSSFCAAIIGRRESGKTYLLMQMLRCGFFKAWGFKFIIFLSPTIALQKQPWKMINPKGILIAEKLDKKLIEKSIEYQGKREEGHILVIMDDLGLQARESDGDVINFLAFVGRHYRVSTIQLAQRWLQLSTSSRTQLDWFFWAGSANQREVSAIHQEYGDHRPTVEFNKMIEDLPERGWLYFKNVEGKMVINVLL